MRIRNELTPWSNSLMYLLTAVATAGAVAMIFLVAPTEKTMGPAQRIVYVHVSVAWLGLLGFLVMAASGTGYLIRRDLRWDRWFQSAGELGWLCCGLTLVTGALWARKALGTWWVWDPRLTTSFILWVIYSGILIVRSSLDDVATPFDGEPCDCHELNGDGYTDLVCKFFVPDVVEKLLLHEKTGETVQLFLTGTMNEDETQIFGVDCMTVLAHKNLKD